MPAKRVLISFGVDVDAVAGWLGSYGGEDSSLDISRGMFAGEVGVPRLLKLFNKYNIKTTWFIPGTFHSSLETFPEQMAAVRDAGHEIGLHGYSHENPVALSVQQQKDILDHTYNLLTAFNHGIPPKASTFFLIRFFILDFILNQGSVAPWWEICKEGVQLLLDKGVEYDHSGMAHDCQAYYLRDEDTWTKIDYSAGAKTWMKPLERGKETGLVCIPGNWYLDDLPPMMFIKSSPNSQGWVNPRDLEEMWKDMFTYCYNNEEEFIFPITIHPDVSGRPQVLLMLERFIQWINTHNNVHWVPMIEIAQEFRQKNKPAPDAQMPKGFNDPFLLHSK
ncbi:hypothetical protein J132_05396 [Termitomyces sp. J132]|nr:hypothetical protein J132_05396 [Termitomyces sp. J132]